MLGIHPRLIAAALLLIAIPAHATVTVTRRPEGMYPNDWANLMRGLWRCEESAGSALVDSAGIMGADLTDHGTVGRDTTNFREGTQSCNFTAASNHYFDCTDGNCGGTTRADFDGTKKVTFGCWHRPTSSATDQILLSKLTGGNGYEVRRRSSTVYRCSIGNSTTDNGDSTTTCANNADCYVICTANGSNIGVSINANTAETTSSSKLPADSGASLSIGDGGSTNDIQGQAEECFLDDMEWDTASKCRACAIGIGTGVGNDTFTTARGMCDPNTPNNYLACSVDADCNAPYGTCVAVGSQTYCASAKCCMGKVASCGNCILPKCDIAEPEAPAGVALTDWTGSALGLWRAEGGTPLVGEGTATNKTLTNADAGTVVTTAGLYMEGAAAFDTAQDGDATSDNFQCVDATCGGTGAAQMDGDAATAMSWGGWFRVTNDPVPTWTVPEFFFGKLGSNLGYGVRRATTNVPNCIVNGTGFSTVAGFAVPKNTWAWLACTADGTNVKIWKDGAVARSFNSSARPSNTSAAVSINATAQAQNHAGQYDEVFVAKTAYGPQTMARICAVTWTGTLGECDGTDNTQWKACASNSDCNSGSGECDSTTNLCQGRWHRLCGGSGSLGNCNKSAPDGN